MIPCISSCVGRKPINKENFIVRFYFWTVEFIHSWHSSSRYHENPEWLDYLAAVFAIAGLIGGFLIGGNLGWESGGYLGVIIFAPVGGALGYMLGGIIGILTAMGGYLGVWVLIIMGIGAVFGFIGDGFSFLWGLKWN